MTEYPRVYGELETIKKVLKGFNLARFGDGEIKMSEGEGYSRQSGSEQLAAHLTEVLVRPHPMCAVGIPTMDPSGPKFPNWDRHRGRILRNISQDVRYYSAFVTRPDSAPWIETRAYAERMQRIWKGKRAVVLCEHRGSMMRAVQMAAGEAIHVECPTHGAYDVIDALQDRIVKARPDVVVLSAGPSATILANRFARHGVHAVDLGSVGQMLCRLLK